MLPTDAPAGFCERHRALHQAVCGIESWACANIKTSGRLLSIRMREEAAIPFEQADRGESNEPMHADQRSSRIHCTVSDSRRSCVGVHPAIRRRTTVARTCAMGIAAVSALPSRSGTSSTTLRHRRSESTEQSVESRPRSTAAAVTKVGIRGRIELQTHRQPRMVSPQPKLRLVAVRHRRGSMPA